MSGTEQSKNNKPAGVDFLWDIMGILYQVNDFNLAGEMLLDTISEKFKIKYTAICTRAESESEFRIAIHHHFDSDFVGQFRLNPFQTFNGQALDQENMGRFTLETGHIVNGNHQFKAPANCSELLLVPVRYQEQLIAFFLLGVDSAAPNDLQPILERFATIAAPVLFSLDPGQKKSNSPENIVAKIIKDRVYDARLSMTPISFAVFRVQFTDELKDSLMFEDVLRVYQKQFSETVGQAGDLLWLTADTSFFVYHNADLFETEKLCKDLKERLRQVSSQDELCAPFDLKYACTSYPQSGVHAVEIINNLYLKLFEDIYMMER